MRRILFDRQNWPALSARIRFPTHLVAKLEETRFDNEAKRYAPRGRNEERAAVVEIVI